MRSSDDSGLSDVSEEVLWTSPGAHRIASRLSPSNTARPQPVDGARPASELRTLFPGSHRDAPGSSLESHDIWHPRAPTRVYVSRGLPHDDISPLAERLRGTTSVVVGPTLLSYHRIGRGEPSP